MKPKILTTIVGYTPHAFAADALAGVTVALVALPLSLAIAIASGAPPAAGLVTAVVAGFLISALGGSRVQIGGPTGAFIVVVYDVIHDHGFEGLLVATLMAGAILVIAGWLHAGRLIRLIPEPVVEGFTLGIAVVIATSQLKDLTGLKLASLPADFLPKIGALWSARGSFDMTALILGLATITAILLGRRLAPRLPIMALVIVVASFTAYYTLPSVESVSARYGALPNRLPWPALPQMESTEVFDLIPTALTIALLAGIESLLSAIVADRMIGGAHRSNAELLAQGAANLVSPLFGGLPATGAIARTATNVHAGGRTPVAGMVHALCILLAMLFAAPLVGQLALPALAGLLVVTAWSMSEPHRWPARLALPKAELALLCLTAALTIFADLTVAIAMGTGLGLALKLAQREEPEQWEPLSRGADIGTREGDEP